MKRSFLILKIIVSIVTVVLFSCRKEALPEEEPIEENSDEERRISTKHNIHIDTHNRMQKIEQWGHDIKQTNKAQNLTVEACQQIFQNGKFNLLRVPFYAMAHEADGSVREDYMVALASTDIQDSKTQWEIISAENDWFYLKNRALGKYMKGFDDDAVEMEDSGNHGIWTQWRLVDAGDGWFHIENRGSQKYLRGAGASNEYESVHLSETINTGTYTQWKLTDDGDGYFYIENKGHKKHLRGGGNQYQPIVDAINRAKDNGKPDIYASHKIFDNQDFSTVRNVNFGPFYTSEGIDASRFAAAIDSFIDYIHTQTGETVKYLAPRCELGGHWTSSAFVQVVNNLTESPLIVGPEAAYTINSDKFWEEGVEQVTDIKSTHNKGNAPDWPAGSIYDWNGETIGGSQQNFFRLFIELNQSFYTGRVTGVVFWGDTHLNNTDGDNKDGPFRRELVEASAYHLVGCDAASYNDGAAAIALETARENEIKVFYVATEPVRFTFDRELETDGIPDAALDVSSKSFVMSATGKTDYHTFIIKYKRE